MFSVNNFYDFFDSHYGWDKTTVTLWNFNPHGSKNLQSLRPWSSSRFMILGNLFGSFILHDQEPFDWWHAANTYRDSILRTEKTPLVEKLSDEEVLLYAFKTTSWPIICHSEQKSADIDWIEKQGLISCYYFWHALVARDWFRHWRRNDDIARDKPLWAYRFLLYARDCSGTRSYRQTVKDRLSGIRQHVLHNWNNHDKISSDQSATIDVHDAVSAGIHIVAETLFDATKIHVTEKCFKPMVMKQPFIVFATAGTLDYLRSYGFRTFHECWDESYDNEQDHSVRFEKIVNLIHQLSSLSIPEFNDLRVRCQQVIDHNHQHFFSDKFESILLDEFHQNVQTSLVQQGAADQKNPGGIYFNLITQLQNRGLDLSGQPALQLQNTIRSLKLHRPYQYQQAKEIYPWLATV